jgi:hypothetical protein
LGDDDVDLPPRPKSGQNGEDAETTAAWYLVGGLGAVVIVVVGILGIVWAMGGSTADTASTPAVAREDRRPTRGEVPPPPAEKQPADEPKKEAAPEGNARSEVAEALSAKDRERVKKATTYLKVHMPGGGISTGSGFFAVEPGVVLTNAHVLGMLKADSPLPQRVQVVCDSGEPTERTFRPRYSAWTAAPTSRFCASRETTCRRRWRSSRPGI